MALKIWPIKVTEDENIVEEFTYGIEEALDVWQEFKIMLKNVHKASAEVNSSGKGVGCLLITISLDI